MSCVVTSFYSHAVNPICSFIQAQAFVANAEAKQDWHNLAVLNIAHASAALLRATSQQQGAMLMLSTRIKDAGIAIRHSRGRILFYTAGSRNGLEGVDGNGIHTKTS